MAYVDSLDRLLQGRFGQVLDKVLDKVFEDFNFDLDSEFDESDVEKDLNAEIVALQGELSHTKALADEYKSRYETLAFENNRLEEKLASIRGVLL